MFTGTWQNHVCICLFRTFSYALFDQFPFLPGVTVYNFRYSLRYITLKELGCAEGMVYGNQHRIGYKQIKICSLSMIVPIATIFHALEGL